MIEIIGLILFIIFGVVIVWYLDRIMFDIGFISWMLDGHPGHDDESDCPIHGPKQ